eukprot:CAMPEP_0170786688 /NCGR_PEP_ID=MMETSP0733-20121128/17810_1 /TAXON_ID=186038 /ORGANISM="Fragilariopsis kerguelensis, Strain L26-C5" /LENGTH=81 /DNA_ID=CAMNT_0011132699 /DNA_START=307 /DNA_END=549 /DNA_ORIENTATION=+
MQRLAIVGACGVGFELANTVLLRLGGSPVFRMVGAGPSLPTGILSTTTSTCQQRKKHHSIEIQQIGSYNKQQQQQQQQQQQ